MAKFASQEEYKDWIDRQDWYQTINLSNGYQTKGKFPTHLRTPILETLDFKGKTVLDIGCNSGQYSLLAKKLGAKKVVGIDIESKRLEQARILAENEGSDIEYQERGVFELADLGRFDIVLCIAVLTEIPDLFGAIDEIKKVIGKYALVELDLAKPLLYLSVSKNWLRGNHGLSRSKAIAEVRKIKSGAYVISPTLELLEAMFGEEFKLEKIKGGLRYDLLKIIRIN